MKKEFERFDMSLPPRRTPWYLRSIKRLLCVGDLAKHKPIITYKNGADKIKGPILLLGNHNAFYDMKIAQKVLHYKDCCFVVAIDGYLGREQLLRNVGCICKRKFTQDLGLIKNLREAIKIGSSVGIYPEARYSLCGTTSVIPESLGKLCKLLKVPVVTVICHGHHINQPFWDTSHDRGVCPTEATATVLFTKEELEKATPDEINSKLVEEFQYDDFAWQKEKGIKVSDPKRADGLEKVLYKCPICGDEHSMISDGIYLECSKCHKKWEMTELGELRAIDGKDKFTHIPDWYEWERACVRKEVEEGTYSTGILNVRVDTLPKDKFYFLGEGTLVHDMNGFVVKGTDVDGDPFEMIKPVESQYSTHIEYRYLFKYGDCIDLNTLDDTWYIYPEGNNFNVTKIALATEELYAKKMADNGVKLKKGLV